MGEKSMKKQLRTSLACAAIATAVAAPAFAQSAGDFVVRLRAVKIDPADKSDGIPALGVPEDAITVSAKVIPEIDFSYFFTKNFAAELILTYPQEHDVELGGTKIGTFKHLPPTLTAQYHFAPDATFRPYVGAGVNYTRISSVDINVPGVGALDLERSSVGYAVQAGFDYMIDKAWSVNFDLKKVQLRADVKAGGAKVSEVRLDPLLLGVGVGKRF
jgi:outer membrane protein